MVIWKYSLGVVGRQSISMPRGAKLLSVANQNGILCLWALVPPSIEWQDRIIEVVGTGYEMTGDDREFIGTALIDQFVWHVFELLQTPSHD